MGQSFIACDREQSFLLPPDVREWLPEDHFAWFVLDAVAQMDLAAADAVDREEDERFGERRGDEVPEHLATGQGLAKWLAEAKRCLEQQRAEEARPIPASRPQRLRESKRRLEEELASECRANE